MSSISSLLPTYLQSTALQAAAATALQSAGVTKAAAGSTSVHTDSGQVSPLAKLMTTLQQLQQSDPTKFAQVTQQIATNLQSAAQTAQANGNTGAANQLNQLAADFTNASKSGQLPNMQDLAKAIGGHHGHHGHHSHAASTDSDSAAASPATDPTAIISKTLETAKASSGSSE